MGDIKRVSD